MKIIKITTVWLFVAVITWALSLILKDEPWIVLSILIWPFVLGAWVKSKRILRNRSRTTLYFLDKFGIKIVVWRKQYRPVHKAMVTHEQIASARKRMIETIKS